VYGSDELYQLAGVPFPPAESYDGFPQVENGVGAVRYLEQHVAGEAAELPDLTGRRVLVCTGTAMATLLPELFPALEKATGATFEIAVLENTYYGPTVTTAGLLPGDAFRRAVDGRRDVSMALLPAESVNEDGKFVDDVLLADLEREAPMPVLLSYHFTDALAAAGSRQPATVTALDSRQPVAGSRLP
jgi:NifB/MoaA-like Fe-S oxidoreductase